MFWSWPLKKEHCLILYLQKLHQCLACKPKHIRLCRIEWVYKVVINYTAAIFFASSILMQPLQNWSLQKDSIADISAICLFILIFTAGPRWTSLRVRRGLWRWLPQCGWNQLWVRLRLYIHINPYIAQVNLPHAGSLIKYISLNIHIYPCTYQMYLSNNILEYPCTYRQAWHLGDKYHG